MRRIRERERSPEEEQRRIREALARTEEDRKRGEEELHHLAAAIRAGDAPSVYGDDRGFPREEETLEDLLARTEKRLREREEKMASLVCAAPMAQARVAGERAMDLAGRAACEEAGAFASCEFYRGASCPKYRLALQTEAVEHRLALARVPQDETSKVVAAADERLRFNEYDSMLLVRAFLDSVRYGRGCLVKIRNGYQAQVAGRERHGEVYFNGEERLLLLGGNVGRGKTMAACWALGELGGLYLTEASLAIPVSAGGIAAREAIRPRLLVIDQLGDVSVGASDYLRFQVGQVIDGRKAARQPTILLGNVDMNGEGATELELRYGLPVMSRIMGYGVVAILGGADLRAKLRKESA